MAFLWCSVPFLFMAMQGCLDNTSKPYFQKICKRVEKCPENGIGEKLCDISILPSEDWELQSDCPSLIQVMRCAEESIPSWTYRNKSFEYFINLGIFNLGPQLETICTSGSHRRLNYMAGISCLKSLLFDGRTYNNCLINGHGTVQSLYLSSTAGSEEEKKMDKMCMSALFGLTCLIDKIQNSCGVGPSCTVREIFLEVISLPLLKCNEANMHSLSTQVLDSKLFDREKSKIFNEILKFFVSSKEEKEYLRDLADEHLRDYKKMHQQDFQILEKSAV